MVTCMAMGHVVWVGLGEVTWTCCVVVSSQLEVVRVAGIKAVGNCEVEDGRCDEMVAVGDGGLDGRWGVFPSGGAQVMWEGWVERV